MPMITATIGFFILTAGLILFFKNTTDAKVARLAELDKLEKKMFTDVFPGKTYSPDEFKTLPGKILNRFIALQDVDDAGKNPLETLELAMTALPEPEKCGYILDELAFSRNGAQMFFETECDNPQANALELEKALNRPGKLETAISVRVDEKEKNKARVMLRIKKR